MAEAPRIDQWSGFSHKLGMDPASPGGIDAAPAWVADGDDKRRLNAYARAAAYIENVGRYFLTDPNAKAKQWRELGDPASLVDRIASAVIGDGMTIVVDGADEPPPPRPDFPPAPEAPDADGMDPRVAAVMQAAYDAQVDAWVEAAEGAVAEWQERSARHPLLEGRQRWLRDWAVDELFDAKMHEAETENCVPLGDVVFVVGWDAENRRPAVDVYEPDAYFPVLDDNSREYPRKVHLAWGFTNSADGKEWVRRVTFELVRLEDLDRPPVAYPYAPDVQSEWTCLKSDGSWPLDKVKNGIVDLSAAGAVWETEEDPETGEEIPVRDYDLEIDFMPVVHVPNTPATVGHFGRSSLVRVAQLLDEIADTDTDAGRASRLAGMPPISTPGLLPAGADRLGPGMIFTGGGERGVSGLTKLSMADELRALEDRADRLLDRLSVNGKVPAGLLGRVDASEVPSGIALTLSFTPFEQMIGSMRLARTHKHRLILKFVQRLAIANAEPDDPMFGEVVYDAAVVGGTYMPQDLAGMIAIVSQALTAGALDTATAVRMLQQVGADIEDVTAVVAAIHAEDFDGAEALANAVGQRYAARRLGITDWSPPDDAVDAEAPVGAAPNFRFRLGGADDQA